jgi:hypothetical protein
MKIESYPKIFFKKLKKRLDMPHGGIVWFIPPVRMLLKISQCLSPPGGSYPREPPFFGDEKSSTCTSP